MERHVAAYSDQWLDTLEDPGKLRRFVSLDPSIAFEPERDRRTGNGAGDRVEVALP